jgi:hypothetical protein
LWIILPYACVFLGIIILHSAWGALISFHIGLLPALIPNRRLIYRSMSLPVLRPVLWPVAISGLIAGPGLWLLWICFGVPVEFQLKVASLGLVSANWPFFIAYFTLVNPWLEEAYWRCVLTSSKRYPVWIDFLFAGYHLIILSMFVGLTWMAFAFAVLSAAGWFWRRVSHYTQSLLPAVFAHTLADLSILCVLYRFAVYPF